MNLLSNRVSAFVTTLLLCANTAFVFAQTPYGGADAETELTETQFKITSTGTCNTSIAGGTAFSQYGATGKYSHTVDEIDVIGSLTLNSSFEEAYSNGYFHESGVTDNKFQYAIVSNPKVLNGKYARKSDKKNRLVMAVGADPSGSTVNLFQFKRTNLAAGQVKISFVVEDLVSSGCPQSNLPSFRQLNVKVYKNGTEVHNEFPQPSIGSSYTFNYTGSVQNGDELVLEVRARFLATCTALAFRDLTFYGCLNKAIETTVGTNVFCEDSEVTLMATGTSASSFTWQTSPDNTNWTTIPGETGSRINVIARIGNTYYKFIEQGGSESDVFSLLGQVCCTYLEDQKAVWKETFGTGTGRWENPNVNTSLQRFQPYPYKIDDGFYAVVSNSSDANQYLDWPDNKKDHTGDPNGGFLVINVNNSKQPPILIYSQTITPAEGFCESTYYNLSLFASNISPAGLPSSFKFEVKDAATQNILGQGSTGDINDFGMAHWLNYGTSFAPENSSSVVINIYNTGAAGGGNDVVIDDIAVTVCNAKIDLYAAYPEVNVKNVCGDNITLTNVVEGSLQTYFGTPAPYFLWTKSTDGGATWSVVEAASGSGKQTYTTKSKKNETALYQVIVAKTGDDARKVFNKESYSGCLIYTRTNEVMVECEGGPEFGDVALSASTGSSVCTGNDITVVFTVEKEGDEAVSDVSVEVGVAELPAGVTVKSVNANHSTSYGNGIWAIGNVLQNDGDQVQLTMVFESSENFSIDAFVSAINESTYTKSEAQSQTGESYYAKSDNVVKGIEPAPTVNDYNECATPSPDSFDLSELVTSNKEHLTWYVDATGETQLSLTTISTHVAQDFTCYVSNYTETTCEGDRTPVHVVIRNVAKFVGQADATCSEDLTEYAVRVEVSGGEVTTDYAGAELQHTGNVWTASKIKKGDNLSLSVMEDGCGSSKEITAPICDCPEIPAPIPEKSTYEFTMGEPVPVIKVTLQGETDNLEVNWYDSAESSTSIGKGLSFIPESRGEYYADAINTVTQCKSNRSKITLIEKGLEIHIPPFFTPNNDGLNDIWHIENIEFYPNSITKIFDRFHKCLILLKGTDPGWDGTYNGHPMPKDDYWYLLQDEELGSRSGHFMLKR